MEKIKEMSDQAKFCQVATRVSMVSIAWNVILTIFKLVAGITANSGAMVSDGIHSASDVFSAFMVIIGVKMASKESDREHPYGHERLECVAAIALSIVLFFTGLMIGLEAFDNIWQGNYDDLIIPGRLALVTAVISILVKEGMFWYTKIYADRIDSSVLMADAWHHRSDAMSSAGALVGIAGARMGYPIMDSVASLVIFAFIFKAAYDIFRDAIDKMVDHSTDEETEQALYDCAMAHREVVRVDMLRTRVFGNKIYVDMEIGVKGTYTLHQAHAIAEKVHDSIEHRFHKVKHIMVHVNPV